LSHENFRLYLRSCNRASVVAFSPQIYATRQIIGFQVAQKLI
jgi:hypothetical protein